MLEKEFTNEKRMELLDEIIKKLESLAKEDLDVNNTWIYYKDNEQPFRVKIGKDGKVEQKQELDSLKYSFEYVNEDTISMSFENDLYDIFNYDMCESIRQDFEELFKKYGLYYELGNAWNLSLFQ